MKSRPSCPRQCTADKWHMQYHQTFAIVCWNCGGQGHKCQECKKPLDQAKIDEARKKFEASKGWPACQNKQEDKKDLTPDETAGVAKNTLCNHKEGDDATGYLLVSRPLGTL